MQLHYFVVAKSSGEYIAHPVLFESGYSTNEDDAVDFETAANAMDYIYETACWLQDGRDGWEVVEAHQTPDRQWAVRFMTLNEIAILRMGAEMRLMVQSMCEDANLYFQ